ncbi:MAG: RecX family transcriptional regulator [Rhodospirillales bacterium]|jgi:regulatory protein|nr:RecX family transcriptional regulator [Rhodospirillales bacterium]
MSAADPARRRKPRKVTEKFLERAALFHLERFATSAENLRRVLMRRVEKSVRFHGTERQAGAALVDDLVARYLASGLLDDRAYAEGRVRTLRRRGASARLIHLKLRQKGVADDVIAGALADHGEHIADPEAAAAAALARRRHLGPFRPPAEREEKREKDLAALARAGFSYDMARRVIEAPSPEDLADDEGP